MNNIAKNIKKYREVKGLTQKQLADAIGKSKNVISNWENGLNKPDPDTIELLLGIFEVDANTFLGWNNPEQLKSDAEELANKIITNDKIKKVLPLIANLSSDDLALVTSFIQRLTDKTK